GLLRHGNLMTPSLHPEPKQTNYGVKAQCCVNRRFSVKQLSGKRCTFGQGEAHQPKPCEEKKGDVNAGKVSPPQVAQRSQYECHHEASQPKNIAEIGGHRIGWMLHVAAHADMVSAQIESRRADQYENATPVL